MTPLSLVSEHSGNSFRLEQQSVSAHLLAGGHLQQWCLSTRVLAWPNVVRSQGAGLAFIHCWFRLSGHCLEFNQFLTCIFPPITGSLREAFPSTCLFLAQLIGKNPGSAPDGGQGSGSLSVPKSAKLTWSNSGNAGVRMTQLSWVLWQRNSKQQNSHFRGQTVCLSNKAWLMMENNSEESREQMDLVAMGTQLGKKTRNM